ncbi:hypothetical protein [Paludibaculum fermentans]|uniref:hypothetical protein n=1 Tax=Paludibaculum fermentans TaxID=1473598 RepID=UPI003EB89129
MDELQALPPARDFVDAERDTAREQITAAWQLHVERLQEQIERGWQENIERVFEERFAALRAGFEAEIEARTAARVAEASDRVRAASLRVMSERLNQTARRLDQAEDGHTWAAALLDGAAAYASRAILFSVINGELQYEDHRSNEEQSLGDVLDGRIALSDAPAFGGVLETMDAVICMATAGEISARLADVLGSSEERRVSLLPVIVGQGQGKRRVAAILYAENEAEPIDVNVLEVITAVAGNTLDARQTAQRQATSAPAGNLMSIAPVAALPAAAPATGPDWSKLPREEQELHAKAQRFARVRVAEMRLYQAQAVRQGREDARLYVSLRGEMDRGRAQFKHEFLQIPSMIDYFHMELVRTLANDDASLLGPEYPGPLV